MNSKKIIIRCRASSYVGFGHLVRCRVLAEEFQELGYEVILVGPSKKYILDSDKKIFCDWIEREEWFESSIEAKYHIRLAEQYGIKHIIIDDYRSDYEHQLLLRKSNLRVLQQYDASKPQRFAANIVVNGSPFEKKEFYEDGLYNHEVLFLHGPKYAILRKDFLKYRRDKIEKKNKLLITFGGGDDQGAIIYLLDEIASTFPVGWTINIVTTEYNPNINLIKEHIQNNKYYHVVLMINPYNMVDVIGSCRLGILSGGTTTFESAYLGTPSILIPLVTNQYNQGIGWDELGAMVYLKPFNEIQKGELATALKALISDTVKIEKMKRIGMNEVDGLGVKRLIAELIKKG